MAGLRGSDQIWGAGATGALVGTSGTTGASASISESVVVGAQDNVVVYIGNTGATGATFAVQVGVALGNAPGLNSLNTALVDEGVQWFDYIGANTQAVPAGAFVAMDLSPFGPQFLRLRRTDNNSSVSIVSYVTSESD